MEYKNYTPFPTLCFESLWPDNREYYTIVARATANIVPGDALQLADEQLPLFVTDAYFEQPGASSLRYPNDLAPFKPMADIILNATAYMPADQPRACAVSVRIGSLEKKLIITGPCAWKKAFTGWRLSEPGPIEKQPIRYEYAFGGTFNYTVAKGEDKVIDVFNSNPVGVGWRSSLADRLEGAVKQMPAPRIYPYTKEQPVFGRECKPEGYGAIAPSWTSRRKYAGSWQAPAEGEDLPSYPSDFDQMFYNSAHPDLIVPYLNGDERVELLNLTPSGRLDFTLPGHTVFLAARYSESEGEDVKVPAYLDTLFIEPDNMRAGLVWRAAVPVSDELIALEARMIFREREV